MSIFTKKKPADGETAVIAEEARYRLLARRVCKIAGLVLFAVIVIVTAYNLIHWKFYNVYKELLDEPQVMVQGREFVPLADSEPNVPGMELVAENEHLKLYTDTKAASVAIYDKRTGTASYSNPPGADNDKNANQTNKAYLKSQLIVEFYNEGQKKGIYDTFSMGVDRGQYSYEAIDNGIRYNYYLADIPEVNYFVPFYLNQEWYDKLQNHPDLTEGDKRRMATQYKIGAEDLYYLKEDARGRLDMQKNQDILFKAGFTEEDYYIQQALSDLGKKVIMSFDISVEYRLEGNSLRVSVPHDSIKEVAGSIFNIKILPAFAAATTEEKGYFVTPNGSGSLIYFNNGRDLPDSYTQSVYDIDLVDANYSQTQNTEKVRLPIFGICREGSSILGVLDEGKSYGMFTSTQPGNNSGNSYNLFYPSFTMRSSEVLSMFGVGGQLAKLPLSEKDIYDYTPTVYYHFLPEEYKGYSGIANYYRQLLLDSQVLTRKEAQEDIPFYYDVLCGVEETAHTLGVQHKRVKAVTTFEQASEMAEILDGLGIKNQVMNLTGWFGGGYYHDAPSKLKLDGVLGNKADLNALNATLEKLNGGLYVDVAFQLVSNGAKNYTLNEEASRYYSSGYVVMLGQVNPANLRRTSSMSHPETMYSLLSPKFLPRYVKQFLNSLDKYEIGGISLRDLGDDLHADKKKSSVIHRVDALDVVNAQLAEIEGTGRNVMVSGGNEYALKYADHVINGPMETMEFFTVNKQIPLYQMIVHGAVDYTGSALNLGSNDNWQKELLRYVEYGASCHYYFTWEEASEMKNTSMNRYYATYFDHWKDQAKETYDYLNEALAPVSNAFIINHETLDNGVVKVSYDNGVCIYINYGDVPAMADGLEVPACDYVMGGNAK